MEYEKVKTEVTAELLSFVSNNLNMKCEIVDLYSEDYLKVYGDMYHSLGLLKYSWLCHRPNAPILDFCNISSDGTFCVSIVYNFNKLSPDMQRRIMANN